MSDETHASTPDYTPMPEIEDASANCCSLGCVWMILAALVIVGTIVFVLCRALR